MRRILLLVTAVALVGVMMMSTAILAFAKSPGGDCSEGFTRDTIAVLIVRGVPEGYLQFIDRNNNGAVCTRELPSTIPPDTPESGHLTIVDDAVPSR